MRQLVPRGTPRNPSRRAQEGSFGSERVFKQRQLYMSVAGRGSFKRACKQKTALNECCRKRPVYQLVLRARGEEGHQET